MKDYQIELEKSDGNFGGEEQVCELIRLSTFKGPYLYN